jgi:hypothetical protein
MKAESDGYTDAVGDIAGAILGPYVSNAAAQADYAARQQAKKQVPVPFVIQEGDVKGVHGWWIINPTWGPSIGGFQIRSLRPGYAGPKNAADMLRVAADLRDPVKNAAAAFAISNGGTDWTKWSVFVHGTYEQYLDVDYELKTGHARADDWDL